MPGELVCGVRFHPLQNLVQLPTSKICLCLLTLTPFCLIRKCLQTKCPCRALSYEKTHEKRFCPQDTSSLLEAPKSGHWS